MPDFLPGTEADAVLAAHARAGAVARLDNPQSCALLTADAFGRFLSDPAGLVLPGLDGVEGVALLAPLQAALKGVAATFIDVAVTTPGTLTGVFARRHEPFRPYRWQPFDKPWQRDWAPGLGPWMQVRDGIQARRASFRHLDAMALAKQAAGLAAAAAAQGRRARLVYLHDDPAAMPDGSAIPEAARKSHRDEIETLAAHVARSAVPLEALTWGQVLAGWDAVPGLAGHAAALRGRFGFDSD